MTGIYEPREIIFTTTNQHSNPYLDVSLSATFYGPTKTLILNGFWDGSNIWKIRFSATEIGIWNYIISSNDSQLNGKTGSFNITNSGKKGFVKVNPDYPHSFMYEDGTPFFWLGDTNWDFASLSTPFDGTFQKYIDTRINQGFTLIQTTLNHEYSGYPRYLGENEGGKSFFSIANDQINPAHFQWLDKRIEYTMNKGLVTAFWLIWAQDWTVQGLKDAKYKRYAKYMISRYAAYNVIFGITGEYEEINNVAAIRDAGHYIKSIDPYNHLLTTHTIGITTDDFGYDSWINFHGQQRKAISTSNFNSLIITDRAYGKPVVNMEQCYEAGIDYRCSDINEYRKAGWAILTGGGFFTYGHDRIAWNKPTNWTNDLNTTGAKEMKYLRDFFDSIEYWKMSPKNNLVSSGFLFGTNVLGKDYVIYLPNGGSTTVDLSSLPGLLNIEWYNPREGTYQGKTTVQGGSSKSFTAPDSNDWVLHIYCPIPSCDFKITVT